MSNVELIKGAFAFVDCLGFKGIWSRKPASQVLSKLINLEEVVASVCAKFDSRDREIGPGFMVASVCSISDGVALSVQYAEEAPPEVKGDESHLVGRICMIMAEIVDLFLIDEPHLLLRGCINYGPHLMNKSFVIGPAVDQAVEYEKVPNGAFIWLSPLAGKLYEDFLTGLDASHDILLERFKRLDISGTSYDREGFDSSMKSIKAVGVLPHVLRDFEMPIKNGEKLVCSVINPLSLQPKKESRTQRIEIYESEMTSERIDVLVKKQNTMAFLAKADEQASQYAEALTAFLKENSEGRVS